MITALTLEETERSGAGSENYYLSSGMKVLVSEILSKLLFFL